MTKHFVLIGRKQRYIGAAFIVLVIFLLLPSSWISTMYRYDLANDYLLKTVGLILPGILLAIALILRVYWIKAILATIILASINFLILPIASIGTLDCGGDITATISLDQACGSGVTFFFKMGLLAIALFFIYMLSILPTKNVKK